jgi:hypothetical protein
MLFLESKTLNHPLDTNARLALLQDLQDRGLSPLIRSHRLRTFEDILLGADRISEMETALAASTESTTGEPYLRGDLFSFDDYILFLVFGTTTRFAPESFMKQTRPNHFESSTHSARTSALLRTGKQALPQCRKAFEPSSRDRTPIRFTLACARKR